MNGIHGGDPMCPNCKQTTSGNCGAHKDAETIYYLTGTLAESSRIYYGFDGFWWIDLGGGVRCGPYNSRDAAERDRR